MIIGDIKPVDITKNIVQDESELDIYTETKKNRR